MKLKNYILIIFLSLSGSIGAQVGINTEEIHEKAVVDIKNSDEEMNDSAKSRVLKYPSVDDITQLPLYNAGEADLFDDDDTMSGMLMYVDDKKELMYYDGKTWLPAVAVGGNETRVKSVSDISFPCVLGICGSGVIPFEEVQFDGLRITKPSKDYFQIAETSMYEVSVSLQIKVSGLSFSNATIKLKTMVNDSERNVKAAEARHFLLHLGDRYVVSYSFLVYLRQGDHVNFKASIPYDIGITGAGITLMGGDYTYVTFRKVL